MVKTTNQYISQFQLPCGVRSYNFRGDTRDTSQQGKLLKVLKFLCEIPMLDGHWNNGIWLMVTLLKWRNLFSQS